MPHFDALKIYSCGNIVRKGEIVCNKLFLFLSQCFLPYMAHTFMPPHRKIGGILFYCCPSVCLHKLNMKTSHFPTTPKLIYLKAHIWYEVTSHQYTSPGTKVKVICKIQGQISGSCFSKDGCFWGISVSQTHLFILKCCPQFVSVWTSLKFCCLVMG